MRQNANYSSFKTISPYSQLWSAPWWAVPSHSRRPLSPLEILVPTHSMEIQEGICLVLPSIGFSGWKGTTFVLEHLNICAFELRIMFSFLLLFLLELSKLKQHSPFKMTLSSEGDPVLLLCSSDTCKWDPEIMLSNPYLHEHVLYENQESRSLYNS